MAWNDAKETRIKEYEVAISELTDNIILQKLATKGATRMLDEKWNGADDKAKVKTADDLFSWDEICDRAPKLGTGRFGNTLVDQAVSLMNEARETGKLTPELMELCVRPTKASIAKVEALLNE